MIEQTCSGWCLPLRSSFGNSIALWRDSFPRFMRHWQCTESIQNTTPFNGGLAEARGLFWILLGLPKSCSCRSLCFFGLSSFVVPVWKGGFCLASSCFFVSLFFFIMYLNLDSRLSLLINLFAPDCCKVSILICKWPPSAGCAAYLGQCLDQWEIGYVIGLCCMLLYGAVSFWGFVVKRVVQHPQWIAVADAFRIFGGWVEDHRADWFGIVVRYPGWAGTNRHVPRLEMHRMYPPVDFHY